MTKISLDLFDVLVRLNLLPLHTHLTAQGYVLQPVKNNRRRKMADASFRFVWRHCYAKDTITVKTTRCLLLEDWMA